MRFFFFSPYGSVIWYCSTRLDCQVEHFDTGEHLESRTCDHLIHTCETATQCMYTEPPTKTMSTSSHRPHSVVRYTSEYNRFMPTLRETAFARESFTPNPHLCTYTRDAFICMCMLQYVHIHTEHGMFPIFSPALKPLHPQSCVIMAWLTTRAKLCT